MGLFAAYKAAEKFPNKQIVVYEKRRSYSRHQVLVIQKDVADLIGDDLKLNENACHITPPPLTGTSRCYSQATGAGMVSLQTNDLEKILKAKVDVCDNVRTINELAAPYKASVFPDSVHMIATGDPTDYFGLGIATHDWEGAEEDYGAVAFFACTDLTRTPPPEPIEPLRARARHDHRLFTVPTHNRTYVGVRLTADEYGALSTLLKRINERRPRSTVVQMELLPDIVRRRFLSAIAEHGLDVKCKTTSAQSVFAFPIRLRYVEPPAEVNVGGQGMHIFLGDAAFNSHFFSGQGVNSGMRSAVAAIDGMTRLDLRSDTSKQAFIGEYSRKISDIRKEAWQNNESIIKFARDHPTRPEGVTGGRSSDVTRSDRHGSSGIQARHESHSVRAPASAPAWLRNRIVRVLTDADLR